MARIWQIKQHDEPSRYGAGHHKEYDSDEEMEAYECGYEKGYEDAMKESRGRGTSMGRGGHRMDDDDDIDYRRERGYRGRM